MSNYFSIFDDFFAEIKNQPKHTKEGLEIIFPGYDKEEILVSMREHVLNVKSKDGKQEQSFLVDKNVDKSKIKCRLKNGILKIDLPLKEKEKFEISIE